MHMCESHCTILISLRNRLEFVLKEELVGTIKEDVHYPRRFSQFFIPVRQFETGSDVRTESFWIREGVYGHADCFSDNLNSILSYPNYINFNMNIFDFQARLYFAKKKIYFALENLKQNRIWKTLIISFPLTSFGPNVKNLKFSNLIGRKFFEFFTCKIFKPVGYLRFFWKSFVPDNRKPETL